MKRREWWIFQYEGDAFIYDSPDDFPPDGDDSVLIHVREVLEGDDEIINDAHLRQQYVALESLAVQILRSSFHGDQWPLVSLLSPEAENLKSAIESLDAFFRDDDEVNP